MGDARFPRCARILNKADFDRVFARPERVSDRYFTVLGRPNGSSDRARVGMAVARKVSRSAVARNRIKRLIRESFRYNQQRLCGIDVVVVARRSAAEQSDNAVLAAALARLWRNLEAKQLCSAHCC